MINLGKNLIFCVEIKRQLDATDDFYAFYFHILTTMHGQNHINLLAPEFGI